MNTKSKVEFKVGDMVKITNYNKERDLGWSKSTIGETHRVIYISDTGNYALANNFTYQGSELIKISNQLSPILTQAELQFLISRFKNELTETESNIEFYKERVKVYWDVCDKTACTDWNFAALNQTKDVLNKQKSLHKKLSEIQRKLKKQVSRSV